MPYGEAYASSLPYPTGLCWHSSKACFQQQSKVKVKRGLEHVLFPALPEPVREQGGPPRWAGMLWSPRLQRGRRPVQGRLQGDRAKWWRCLSLKTGSMLVISSCWGRGTDFKFTFILSQYKIHIVKGLNYINPNCSAQWNFTYGYTWVAVEVIKIQNISSTPKGSLVPPS